MFQILLKNLQSPILYSHFYKDATPVHSIYCFAKSSERELSNKGV